MLDWGYFKLLLIATHRVLERFLATPLEGSASMENYCKRLAVETLSSASQSTSSYHTTGVKIEARLRGSFQELLLLLRMGLQLDNQRS